MSGKAVLVLYVYDILVIEVCHLKVYFVTYLA